MPSNEPSSAPQADAPRPADDLTAAAVLRDDGLDRPAGGGGLGADGADAGPLPVSGAASPNSPATPPVPHDSGDAQAAVDARRQSLATPPAEPGHSSR